MQQVSGNQPLRPGFMTSHNELSGTSHNQEPQPQKEKPQSELNGQGRIQPPSRKLDPNSRHDGRQNDYKKSAQGLKPTCGNGMTKEHAFSVALRKKIHRGARLFETGPKHRGG